MFCPRCRDEFRAGFTWFHDCNVALVESLRAEPSAIRIADGETEVQADDTDAAQADTEAGPEGTDIPENQALVTVGEAAAQAFDERVEAVRLQNLIQPLIERMPRARWQITRRDP